MIMPIKKILKILGFIFVPLLPLAVAMYFLFPYINEEKHQEVAEKNSDEFVIGDSADVELSSFSEMSPQTEPVKDIGKDYAKMEATLAQFKENVDSLNSTVDSLTAVNDSLAKQLTQRKSGNGENTEGEGEISDEKFAENVKSLLDLDVENLTPILSNMSDKQLVRIFEAGSGLQRKKLLRSLESDRAAKLMTEVL